LASASTRKQTIRYRYDALGRRIQRFFAKGGVENTKFIYDGLDVIADDNSGTLTKYQNGLGIDNKLKISLNGTARYFLSDHLGSSNALTDSSGAIVESANYDSFGNATGNLSTRYQYTGREFDNFTGLYFYRARWYDSNLGRFISEDPIGFEGGDVNLYGYVGSNPVSRIDPLGLQDTDVIILNSPPFNNPKPINCSCNKDSDDVRRMREVFDSSVYQMTVNGQRHANPYWNNFWSTFGASYIGCGQQADKVTGDLQTQVGKPNWQFQIKTGFTPLYHQWGEATSNNPNDPVIRYDPWYDEFEVKCRCEQ
jgi:RHS repeat-associated protein